MLGGAAAQFYSLAFDHRVSASPIRRVIGLLRRHDYTVDILGGATGLNYASKYRDVEGIIFFTRRRIYAYEGDYRPVPEPLLVAIDMGKISLRTATASASDETRASGSPVATLGRQG